MRKYRKHKDFTIEEKNEIVLLYLDKHMGRAEIMRNYDVSSFSVLHRWIQQYKEFGTCVDRRGKGTKKDIPNKGRPKKYKVDLDELSKEDLIEKIRMYVEIKKSMAYLIEEQQN